MITWMSFPVEMMFATLYERIHLYCTYLGRQRKFVTKRPSELFKNLCLDRLSVVDEVLTSLTYINVPLQQSNILHYRLKNIFKVLFKKKYKSILSSTYLKHSFCRKMAP